MQNAEIKVQIEIKQLFGTWSWKLIFPDGDYLCRYNFATPDDAISNIEKVSRGIVAGSENISIIKDDGSLPILPEMKLRRIGGEFGISVPIG